MKKEKRNCILQVTMSESLKNKVLKASEKKEMTVSTYLLSIVENHFKKAKNEEKI
jgi:hypothetical protein